MQCSLGSSLLKLEMGSEHGRENDSRSRRKGSELVRGSAGIEPRVVSSHKPEMIEVFQLILKRVTSKKIFWLGLLVLALIFADPLITSMASKSYRYVVNVIFDSADVQASVGKVHKLLLYSSSFYGSGGYSCSTFSFIAVGDSGLELLHAQVRQASPSGEFEISEVTRGAGTEFSKNCSRL